MIARRQETEKEELIAQQIAKLERLERILRNYIKYKVNPKLRKATKLSEKRWAEGREYIGDFSYYMWDHQEELSKAKGDKNPDYNMGEINSNKDSNNKGSLTLNSEVSINLEDLKNDWGCN